MNTDPVLQCLIQAKLIDTLAAEEIAETAQQAEISALQLLATCIDFDTQKIAQIIAAYLGLEYFDLQTLSAENIITHILDNNFIQQHRVLPLYIEKMQLYLAISEPKHLDLMSEIKFYTDLTIIPVITDIHKLAQLIDDYLHLQRHHEIEHFNQPLIDNAIDDERLIQLLQDILCDAAQKGASDIHFEPYKTVYRIRVRIDGILHKILQIPTNLANRITARLKIMAKLNIAERRLPQDGRFAIEINPQITKDCRINICPTLFGEKSVIRILDAGKISLNIDELGFDTVQLQIFRQALQRPQGMIVVTGPTGSGKTVTLYSALNILNTLEKNISTVEEPVEIQLPGINQINVNAKINLTFTSALRALLRQDPDIIMIGEIRDLETAEIALKAAQTGHLVISTLHTNSAAEALNRLTVMGLSTFNIAHALQLVIAQRLLRKLCERCKKPQALANKTSLIEINDCITDKSTIYQAVGCDYCTKGYKGRIGVFEFLPITEPIIKLILNNAPATEISAANQLSGIKNLQKSAFDHVKTGKTTLEEIYRILL